MKKKLLIFSLVTIIALSLTGCSNFVEGFKKGYNGEEETEVKETEVATEAPTERTETTKENKGAPTDEEIRIAHYFQQKLDEETQKIHSQYEGVPITDDVIAKQTEEQRAMEEKLTNEVAKELNLTTNELDEIFYKVVMYETSGNNKEPDFKTEAEANAKKYPATAGRVLVTKGKHKFTGMRYYFKGKVKSIGISEGFGDKIVWLVQNEEGYVMPVQMTETDKANMGDEIEIWGTLSGEGYQLPNVDNVVGETGYLIMMQYNLNGKPII